MIGHSWENVTGPMLPSTSAAPHGQPGHPSSRGTAGHRKGVEPVPNGTWCVYAPAVPKLCCHHLQPHERLNRIGYSRLRVRGSVIAGSIDIGTRVYEQNPWLLLAASRNQGFVSVR